MELRKNRERCDRERRRGREGEVERVFGEDVERERRERNGRKIWLGVWTESLYSKVKKVRNVMGVENRVFFWVLIYIPKIRII